MVLYYKHNPTDYQCTHQCINALNSLNSELLNIYIQCAVVVSWIALLHLNSIWNPIQKDVQCIGPWTQFWKPCMWNCQFEGIQITLRVQLDCWGVGAGVAGLGYGRSMYDAHDYRVSEWVGGWVSEWVSEWGREGGWVSVCVREWVTEGVEGGNGGREVIWGFFYYHG